MPESVLTGGRPWPLGAHATPSGVQFAIPSEHAHAIEIEIFDAQGHHSLGRHRLGGHTDGVFHGILPGTGPGLVYGLRAHGPWQAHGPMRFNAHKLLLDPWAREIVGTLRWHAHLHDTATHLCVHDSAPYMPKARVALDVPPMRGPMPWRVPDEQVVIYELHVKGFTRQHPEVPPELRGTYAGLAHPAVVAHLRRLGVTTVCLLPVAWAADEPFLLNKGLTNYWGYNPLGMLAPSPRLASAPHDPTLVNAEFRSMVDTLHAVGIEVVLDLVFNHTAEGGDAGPTLSMRGLDPTTWYLWEADGRMTNHSGCGNTVQLAEPRVVQFVLDALRHWVGAYGVDGFRFDLASVLGRTPQGFSPNAPFFTALRQDPLLSGTRLIAEPWDIGADGYHLGRFPRRFAEWNDKYRDSVRRYWMGLGTPRGELAERLAGSSDIFRAAGRAPASSVNYIAAHDGFTLLDMLSHSHKHNEANGEHNRDGRDGEPCIHCGVEGPSSDPQVQRSRGLLQRALLGTLLLSRGTPMLRGGDEIGQTQHGNNNAYCQDNALSWIDWSQADTGLAAYCADVLALRRSCPDLLGPAWLDPPHLQWLGLDGAPMEPHDWRSAETNCLALLLRPSDPAQKLVWIGLNPGGQTQRFNIPAGEWRVRLDSSATHAPQANTQGGISLAAHSLLVLEQPSGLTHLS